MPDSSPFTIDHSRPVLGLMRVLLIAFVLVAASLVYWTAVRAPALLSREDNPRLVEAELRIQRGSIFDRQDQLLAFTSGAGNQLIRQYPIPDIGPAVGYYSFRHGAAGVEESMNAVLRGDPSDLGRDWWRRAQHQPQVGRDVRLTLDADLQATAVALLGDHTGALILLGFNEGYADILALASQPSYDPNRLNAEFERLTSDANAPLLNRVTQGQYQPGMLLAPFIVAVAVEQGIITLDEVVANPNRPLPIDGVVKQCAAPPPNPATWQDVLRYRCPAPLYDLGRSLGNETLGQMFAVFQLTSAPQLLLETAVPPLNPLQDAGQAAIGQDDLLVTPLQLALAWGALGNNGRYLPPRLVSHVQSEAGAWQPYTTAYEGEQGSVSTAVAQSVRRALPQNQSIREYSMLVLSGPDSSANGWYLGLYPAGNPRYVVVVVLEGIRDVTAVQAVGQGMVNTGLVASE